MKKIYVYILMLITWASANSVESEIGIYVGMTATNNDLGSELKNKTIGATLQYNNYVVMPRFDLEYVNIADNQVASLIKGSFNGVYEFENNTVLTPYIIAGVGYEDVKGGIKDTFESHPFIHGGGGLVYNAPNAYHIKGKIEGKMLQIIGGNNEENEASVIAGVTVPVTAFQSVSRPRPKAVTVQPPVPRVIQRPSMIQRPRVSPPVNDNECSIKIAAPDSDRDGIENRFDQCPNTPCDFTVDHYGCPVKTTLKINFKTNSSEIDFQSMPKVYTFAKILLANKGSKIQVLGYTDSRGSASKNLLLSERRAQAVVRALIGMGISPSRIHAEGRGESMPIASNETEYGRSQNRRIEAVLSYPERRNQ